MRDVIAGQRLLFDLPLLSFEQIAQTEDGQIFLLLPDLSGVSVAEYVEFSGPLPPILGFQIALNLVELLERLHQRRHYVGELQPWTVLLPSDDSESLRLIDPGLGRRLFERNIQAPSPDPYFSSPRVLGGQQPQARDDLYALGALLSFMLRGASLEERVLSEQGLFSSATEELLKRTLSEEMISLQELERGLRGLRDLYSLSPEAQELTEHLLNRDGRPPPLPKITEESHSFLLLED